ncbi:MAG: 4-hydroxy-3-methylbut-2-enyl diphosphate reductase [Firmicutes bacterium]|nr:4-hydroxy-3-methylbut-2-enyl diphosphate reductase [Bacillota bacterium]
MEVVKITPRGYCYGVVDALTLAKRLARDPAVPRPIFVLGQIVHNRHAVDDLARLGIQTLDGKSRLDLLDEVPEGASVIFTAHGVSPAVREKAKQRGLTLYDATCPDVTKTHQLIREKVSAGYHIIYVGTPNHPEPEGAMGEAPQDRVTLVSRVEDIRQLAIKADTPIAVVTQTTLSQWDTAAILEAIQMRFPHAEIYNEICLATQQRQEAAVAAAADVDLVIVVGDRRSNNSNRLVEVVTNIGGKPAFRVEDVNDLNPAWFHHVHRVGVTAGSSTPSPVTRAVIRWLEAYGGESSATGQASVEMSGQKKS